MRWRWFRTEDLAISHNIEDRRGDKPRTYWQIMMDWWTGPKEDIPIDSPSKLSRDLGLNDLTKEKYNG